MSARISHILGNAVNIAASNLSRFIARRPKNQSSASFRNLQSSIEGLEPRLLFTTISWTGGAGDGLWTSANNWNTVSVPATGDDVAINVSGNPTISLVGAGNVTIQSLQLSDSLTIPTSQALTVTDENQALAGTINVTGGSLTIKDGSGSWGNSGTITMTGGVAQSG